MRFEWQGSDLSPKPLRIKAPYHKHRIIKHRIIKHRIMLRETHMKLNHIHLSVSDLTAALD